MRKTERTAAIGAATNKPDALQGELLVEHAPFRCLLLANNPPSAPPIAFIEFPSMKSTLGDRWDTFLDQAMTAANACGAAGLIVDIRDNGGGNSKLGDALLARVNDHPYRRVSRAVWRKSPDSDELLRSKAKPMWRWLFIALPFFIPDYAALKHGEDLISESKVTSYPRVVPGFDGQTCLLIGERTFSSAMMLADGVRTYDLMLTIGQPTGGVPNALGDIVPFQLPNSRLVVPFSMKTFVRGSGDEVRRRPCAASHRSRSGPGPRRGTGTSHRRDSSHVCGEGRMILAKLIDEVEVSRHFMREEGGLQDRARLRVLETISSLISHIGCLVYITRSSSRLCR